jgi:hypothetical protein
MSKSGAELGGDLALIYQTGAQHLPRLAEQFTNAKNQADPISGDSSAWDRDASIGIGQTGCMTAFNDYVDAISAHLATTAANLNDTGAALCHAATDLAATDAGAKAEFDKLKNTDVIDD